MLFCCVESTLVAFDSNLMVAFSFVSRPAELQLSTSAKLLIRERERRTSIQRKTIGLKPRFVEDEKQFLWTFRDLGDQPSLLLIPNHLINRRTLTLYACVRLVDRREQDLRRTSNHLTEDETVAQSPVAPLSQPPPMLTLFPDIKEPFPLPYGTEKSLYGRIDRQSTKLLIVDHRERAHPFAITLKTSLIQNTTSGGGAGAAAVVAAHASTASTKGSSSESAGEGTDSTAAHSFIFVVKHPEETNENARHRSQNVETALPKQWYTSIR